MSEFKLITEEENNNVETPQKVNGRNGKIGYRKICELRSFSDDEGRTVTGKYPLGGFNPCFVGTFAVPTNVGLVRLNIEFPENMTLQECFEKFDEYAEKTVREAQSEAMDRNRIITPDQLKRSGGGLITS